MVEYMTLYVRVLGLKLCVDFFEFYVVFATALMLKHQDLKMDILKIEAVRYEKILLENANANVQNMLTFESS